MNRESQSSWYLVSGLILGLVVGLLVSLVISPLRYEGTDPSALDGSARSQFRQLAALAYQANANLPRAEGRLALLQDAQPLRELAAQAQRIVAEGGSPDDARALAGLAGAINNPGSQPPAPTAGAGESTAIAALTTPEPGAENPDAGPSPTPGEAVLTATPVRPTPTPLPTFTPRPSATPPRVLDAPFVLTNQVQVCDSSLPVGRLAVTVLDRNGQPLAGVPITVTWGEGQSSKFYTGLAPEISLGYADFEMLPNISYTLKVGEASEAVSGLGIPSCGGGWRVEFKEGG